MIRSTRLALVSLLLYFPSIPVRAEDAAWMTDFEAAKAKAKAEKKLLLVDITGSDWCEFCKLMNKEVFDSSVFKKEAPKLFVLMLVDVPKDKSKLPPAIIAQNDKLMKTYNTKNEYPTVLLMDSAGKVVAKTGYRLGGGEKYVKFLSDLNRTWQDILQSKADLLKIKGNNRIKPLDQMADGYDKLRTPGEDSLSCSKEIIALDPKNKSGLKPKHEYRLSLRKIGGLIEKKEVIDAVAALRIAKKIPGLEEKQTAELESQLKKYQNSAEGLQTYVKLRPSLDRAKGASRAKLLDQLATAYERIDPPFNSKISPSPNINAWREEIVSLDPNNRAGLQHKHIVDGTVAEAKTLAGQKQFDPALAKLDKTLELPWLAPPQIHKLWFWKGKLHEMQNDNVMLCECWKKAIAADPKNAENADMEKQIARFEPK